MTTEHKAYLVVVAALVGFIIGSVVSGSDVANCPQEDSCIVDYFDGEWHIEEVQP